MPTLLARLPMNRLRAVLLTHFHSDYIASVADFNLNSWVAGRPEPIRVIGPVGVSQVVEGLNRHTRSIAAIESPIMAPTCYRRTSTSCARRRSNRG